MSSKLTPEEQAMLGYSSKKMTPTSVQAAEGDSPSTQKNLTASQRFKQKRNSVKSTHRKKKVKERNYFRVELKALASAFEA